MRVITHLKGNKFYDFIFRKKVLNFLTANFDKDKTIQTIKMKLLILGSVLAITILAGKTRSPGQKINNKHPRPIRHC